MSLPLSYSETVLLRLSYRNRRLMMPRLMMLTTAKLFSNSDDVMNADLARNFDHRFED